jgi:hypothetical protein
MAMGQRPPGPESPHYPGVASPGTTTKLMVSDWQNEKEPGTSFGQEQTFNFWEIQPYRE